MFGRVSAADAAATGASRAARTERKSASRFMGRVLRVIGPDRVTTSSTNALPAPSNKVRKTVRLFNRWPVARREDPRSGAGRAKPAAYAAECTPPDRRAPRRVIMHRLVAIVFLALAPALA